MEKIFKIKDKNEKVINLTKGRWAHITSPASPHAYMTNYLEEMKETIIYPDKIIKSMYDNSKANYYKYYKNKKQYLKVIVNYLNREGYVITSYFVKNIG